MKTTSLARRLKIAAFYDVHLGHHRTTTEHIIEGFTKILDDETEISTWDILAFPGDLFDRALMLTHQSLGDIFMFFSRLLKKCEKYDITILVLEGTPGHDWKQSRIFKFILNAISEHRPLKVDLHYVDKLCVEYLPKFDINILYVPDEWNTDIQDTYDEAVQAVHARGLDQVDFCLFHGAFNYQIDANLNPKAHNEDLWSSLVRYYIFAGHVHFRSQYKNILVGGSFDRLAHGEEQDKGWVTCEICQDGQHEIIFHDNPYATKYITIDVRGKTPEEVLSIVRETCSNLPEHSHVRLFTYDRDAINDAMKHLKTEFQFIFFTTKVDKKEKQQRTLKIAPTKFESIDLNPENIQRIVSDKLNQLPNVDTSKVLGYLQKFLVKG
jgi:PHIKZ065